VIDLGVVVWAVVGVGAGWLAGLVMGRGGYGVLGDLLLGLLGSFVATLLFEGLGLSSHPASFASIMVAFVGAAGVIFAQRHMWPPGV
jgi:uncharacterized membrane protein YeaQ/YmgE (transglycosylase-associated protein family)